MIIQKESKRTLLEEESKSVTPSEQKHTKKRLPSPDVLKSRKKPLIRCNTDCSYTTTDLPREFDTNQTKEVHSSATNLVETTEKQEWTIGDELATLKRVFQDLPTSVGCVVEIKYPSREAQERWK